MLLFYVFVFYMLSLFALKFMLVDVAPGKAYIGRNFAESNPIHRARVPQSIDIQITRNADVVVTNKTG